MNLNKNIVDYILKVVKIAKLVKIDGIIIEPGRVRAMNDDRTIGLFSDRNVPDIPFGSLGIQRIQELATRLETSKDIEDFTIDITGKEDEARVTYLTITAKGLKIDYRCGDPRKIAAPKILNDTDCFKVKIDETAVSMFQKGLAVMKSEEVSIVSNNGVSFEFTDISHDIYKYTFAKNVDLIPNEEGEVSSTTKFVHRYDAKKLLALFKSNTDAEFTVGIKGMLKFPLNGLIVFVMPSV